MLVSTPPSAGINSFGFAFYFIKIALYFNIIADPGWARQKENKTWIKDDFFIIKHTIIFIKFLKTVCCA